MTTKKEQKIIDKIEKDNIAFRKEREESIQKYQAWLSENGCTKDKQEEFTVAQNSQLGEIYLYKKISTFKI